MVSACSIVHPHTEEPPTLHTRLQPADLQSEAGALSTDLILEETFSPFSHFLKYVRTDTNKQINMEKLPCVVQGPVIGSLQRDFLLAVLSHPTPPMKPVRQPWDWCVPSAWGSWNRTGWNCAVWKQSHNQLIFKGPNTVDTCWDFSLHLDDK